MKTSQLRYGSKTVTLKSERRNGQLIVEIEGAQLTGDFQSTGPGSGLWKVGDRTLRVAAAEKDGKIWASVNGRVYVFEDARKSDEMGAGAGSDHSVTAPMPGKVIKVFVEVGSQVEEGQPVIIVEAMKMEHTLRAPHAATVAKLNCAEGQQVNSGVPLLEFETEA